MITADEYLNILNIHPAESSIELYRMLDSALGKELSERLRNASSDRVHSNEDHQIYSIMNESLDTCITFVGGFEGQFLKKWLNNLTKYMDLMRGDIVELGCNCGITTCFVAKMLPDHKVFGIDKNPLAIENAKELAKRLSLENVEFITGNIMEESFGQFDTVISAKVSQEVAKHTEHWKLICNDRCQVQDTEITTCY